MQYLCQNAISITHAKFMPICIKAVTYARFIPIYAKEPIDNNAIFMPGSGMVFALYLIYRQVKPSLFVAQNRPLWAILR